MRRPGGKPKAPAAARARVLKVDPDTGRSVLCGRLAEAIQRLRRARRLSLKALAAQARVSRTMLRLIERGLRVPTVDMEDRIACALGLRASQLLALAEEGR